MKLTLTRYAVRPGKEQLTREWKKTRREWL